MKNRRSFPPRLDSEAASRMPAWATDHEGCVGCLHRRLNRGLVGDSCLMCVDFGNYDNGEPKQRPISPISPKKKIPDHHQRKNHRSKNPKYITRLKTRGAINGGNIPPAHQCRCAMCGVPAREYHHKSYDRDDSYLDVLPVCVSCHNAIHLEQGGDETFFSVVRSPGN